jgi:protein-tyrosine phosphatase
VEALPEGGLVVGWTCTEDGDLVVDVAMGSSPDAAGHTHLVTVGGAERSLRIADPGPGRHYVSLTTGENRPVVVGERRVRFDGATNFRDIGGYRASGGMTRWGVVFRSDALHRLTSADLELYGRLGIRAVYDLRGAAERESRPDPFTSAHMPVLGRPVVTDDAGPVRSELRLAADGERLLRDMYCGILEHSAPVLGDLLGGLAGPAALPALFHCTGGKDRTGILMALLLEMLGVERETVLDDYQLTARFRTRAEQGESYESLLASGLAPEAAVGVLGAPRWAMAEALDELDARYGGAQAYLVGHAGISPERLQQVRAALVA